MTNLPSCVRHVESDSRASGNRPRVKISGTRYKACLQAKIATGEIVHIDASLIRANVSWESLIERHVVEVLDENNIEGEKQDRQSGKSKKVCVTDPDATMPQTRATDILSLVISSTRLLTTKWA
jgi:hypothetical protein